jgi:hypothetical protein
MAPVRKGKSYCIYYVGSHKHSPSRWVRSVQLIALGQGVLPDYEMPSCYFVEMQCLYDVLVENCDLASFESPSIVLFL